MDQLYFEHIMYILGYTFIMCNFMLSLLSPLIIVLISQYYIIFNFEIQTWKSWFKNTVILRILRIKIHQMVCPIRPAKPLLTITALSQNERMVKMTNCKTLLHIAWKTPNIPCDMAEWFNNIFYCENVTKIAWWKSSLVFKHDAKDSANYQYTS